MKLVITFVILLLIVLIVTFLYAAICVSGDTEKYYERLHTPRRPIKKDTYMITGGGLKANELECFFCPNCDQQVSNNQEYCSCCFQKLKWR